jgi:transcriptional regulator with XRE-family HTH domain
MSMPATNDNPLGTYLKDRRTKLDPAAFGIELTRRRTPGLRREEVAQRANVSATWYTWLEQGRVGRPPDVRYQASEGVTPRLQRVLDALEFSPAVIKTATWDAVAWNRAAAATLTDYGALPPEQRNILRIVFCDPRVRAAQSDWERAARFVVGAFRVDVARAVGATSQVADLVDELCRLSPEFEALWRDNDVRAHGEGVKHLRHPIAGPIAFEYSTFAVDGRPDLSLVIYNPATPADVELVRSLVDAFLLESQ